MSRVLVALALSGCFSKPPFDVSPPDGDGGMDDGDMPDVDFAGNNVAFVTSKTRIVSMSAGSLGGITGADDLCAQSALDGNLPPNKYLAWLSTPMETAISRLGSARGWIRVDGRPFARDAGDIAAGRILHPLRRDEYDADASSAAVATATDELGQHDPLDCNELGTVPGNEAMIRTGSADATTETWTEGELTTPCLSPLRIYCFGTDKENDLTVMPVPGRIAFLSSPWLPNGGRLNADALCASNAANAPDGPLPGTFVAFLATSVDSAAARFNASGPPWVRVDGIPLADTAQDVLQGKLTAPLNVTAMGAYFDDTVWTGIPVTKLPNATADNDCNLWTSSASTATAHIGRAERTSNIWYGSNAAARCDIERRLYCLQL